MIDAVDPADNKKAEALRNRIIEILESKKAIDINSIGIGHLTILADYFVICTGTSLVHIKTLADELEEKMEEAGIRCAHREGFNNAKWILMDYGEVIVHIFHESERQYYNLERLWADGKIEIIRSRLQ